VAEGDRQSDVWLLHALPKLARVREFRHRLIN
jgi:hypothetical protein